MTQIPPTPQEQPAVPVAEQPGELLERFLARLIDGVLLAVVNGVVVTAVIVTTVMGESANGFSEASTVLAGVVASVLSTAIYLGYYAFLDSTRGQTVGKMVMKLKVVAPSGGNPTIEESVRRNVFMAFGLLGVIPVVGGLVGGLAQLVGVIMVAVGINSDPVRRQAWHDRFAGGTAVVKTA